MNPLIYNAAILGGAFFLAWLLSIKLRDVSIVDIGWGFAYATVAGVSAYCAETMSLRSWMLLGVTAVWGVRLGVFLGARNIGHGEDKRYAAMRASIGPRYWWVSLFTVFTLQFVLVWGISIPVQLGITAAPSAVGPIEWIGLGVAAVGLFFESVGDYQLAKFKRDPANAGKVMDRGLWRYTRHPNYFGDACMWWGLFLIAAPAGLWWTIFSPLLMNLLLLKVSGVAMLERTITERRPAYVDYIARTNAFFPGPPRDKSAPT